MADEHAVMGRYAGKSVVITGAARGIGEAFARRFAAEGATVIMNDVDAPALSAAAERVNAAGGNAVAAPADISTGDGVDTLFEAAVAAAGVPHVLINNAAAIKMAHILDVDERWWRSVIDVNLTGAFLCAHRFATLAAPMRRGVIINISSGGASRAHRGMCAYDAAKGGIEALTRSLALDLGPYGMRAVALAPGSIDTTGMIPDEAASRGLTIPLGRVGTPDEMAGMAAFLASDDAAYVTGTVHHVDGGLLAQQRSPEVDIFGYDQFPVIPPA